VLNLLVGDKCAAAPFLTIPVCHWRKFLLCQNFWDRDVCQSNGLSSYCATWTQIR